MKLKWMIQVLVGECVRALELLVSPYVCLLLLTFFPYDSISIVYTIMNKHTCLL